MGNVRREAKSGTGVALTGGWMLLLCGLPAVVSAAGATDYDQLGISGKSIGLWLVTVVVGVLVRSVWYWLGSRIFRCKPPFLNCFMAAIVPPIVIFLVRLVAAFIIAIFMCLSVTIGYFLLVVMLIYTLILYIKWVHATLEIESMGVTVFLVLMPFAVELLFYFVQQP